MDTITETIQSYYRAKNDPKYNICIAALDEQEWKDYLQQQAQILEKAFQDLRHAIQQQQQQQRPRRRSPSPASMDVDPIEEEEEAPPLPAAAPRRKAPAAAKKKSIRTLPPAAVKRPYSPPASIAAAAKRPYSPPASISPAVERPYSPPGSPPAGGERPEEISRATPPPSRPVSPAVQRTTQHLEEYIQQFQSLSQPDREHILNRIKNRKLKGLLQGTSNLAEVIQEEERLSEERATRRGEKRKALQFLIYSILPKEMRPEEVQTIAGNATEELLKSNQLTVQNVYDHLINRLPPTVAGKIVALATRDIPLVVQPPWTVLFWAKYNELQIYKEHPIGVRTGYVHKRGNQIAAEEENVRILEQDYVVQRKSWFWPDSLLNELRSQRNLKKIDTMTWIEEATAIQAKTHARYHVEQLVDNMSQYIQGEMPTTNDGLVYVRQLFDRVKERHGIKIVLLRKNDAYYQRLRNNDGRNTFYTLCGAIPVSKSRLTQQGVLSDDAIESILQHVDADHGHYVYLAVDDRDEILGFLNATDWLYQKQHHTTYYVDTIGNESDRNQTTVSLAYELGRISTRDDLPITDVSTERLISSLYIDFLCSKSSANYMGRPVQVVDGTPIQGKILILRPRTRIADDSILSVLAKDVEYIHKGRVAPFLMLQCLLDNVERGLYGLLTHVAPSLVYQKDWMDAQGEMRDPLSKRPNSELIAYYQRQWRLERTFPLTYMDKNIVSATSGMLSLQDEAIPYNVVPSSYRTPKTMTHINRRREQTMDEMREEDYRAGLLYRPYPTLADIFVFMLSIPPPP
jgi:hypothetical protein